MKPETDLLFIYLFLPKPKFRDRKEKEILRVFAAALMIQVKDNKRRDQRKQTVKNRINENFNTSKNTHQR